MLGTCTFKDLDDNVSKNLAIGHLATVYYRMGQKVF